MFEGEDEREAGTETPAAAEETGAPDPQGVEAEDTTAPQEATGENEASEDTSGEEKAEDEKPKKSRARERIEALTRDRSNLRRQLARANQKIGELKAGPRPNPNEFNDVGEFNEASFRRAARLTAVESQVEQTHERLSELQQETLSAWNDVRNEALQKMPDFDQVFNDQVPVPPHIGDMIIESENSAEVAYYLGKNRQLAAQIAGMSPQQAAMTLGRIDAQMSIGAAPKTISQAPKPVAKVTGKAHKSAKTPDQMSNAEYAAWRQAGGGQ